MAWEWLTNLFGGSDSSSGSGGGSEPIGSSVDGGYIYGPSSSSGGSGGGSWLGNAYNWINNNSDDIGGVLNFGRQVYNLWDTNSARQGSRGDILNFLKQQDAADNAYAQQMWAYQNAQRGAAAAAARAQDAARRKASKKAFKQQKKVLNQLIKQYQPYNDAVQQLTPKMSQNYAQFLDTTALLNQYLTPKVMETFGSAPKPAYEQAIPRTAYAVRVPESAPISFPTPEEALKRK